MVSIAGAQLGSPLADPIGAFVVLALVGRIGVGVLWENLTVLLDVATLDPATVIATAHEIEGVRGVHRVRSRGTAAKPHLDLHLLLDGNTSVAAGHELAHRVEDHLRERLPSLGDVTIHIEPAGDPEEPL